MLPESDSVPDSPPSSGFGEREREREITDTAFVVVHDNVLSPPEFTVAGVAVNVPIVGGTGCATFTITDWLALPPAPVAVNTYVVVCCGVTPEMLPPSGNADVLTDGTILTEVALKLCHASVIGVPAVMLVELAEKDMLGGCGVTVTVTDCVALPPGPVAVKTYVVARRGVTTALPLNASADEPTAGAIATDVAFAVCHISVTDCPARTPSALEENVTAGADAFTVIVTDWVVVAPAPVTVIVYVVVVVGADGQSSRSSEGMGQTIAGEKLTVVAFEVCHCNRHLLTRCDRRRARRQRCRRRRTPSGLEAFELPQEDRPAIARIRHNKETGRRSIRSGRLYCNSNFYLWSDRIQPSPLRVAPPQIPVRSQRLSSPGFLKFRDVSHSMPKINSQNVSSRSPLFS